MNPFGMAAGEMPEDVMDRKYDAATVFKNFSGSTAVKGERRTESGSRREYTVEVRKPKRILKSS